jgi:hypothetical protein
MLEATQGRFPRGEGHGSTRADYELTRVTNLEGYITQGTSIFGSRLGNTGRVTQIARQAFSSLLGNTNQHEF